jgi:hypothetical protein
MTAYDLAEHREEMELAARERAAARAAAEKAAKDAADRARRLGGRR